MNYRFQMIIFFFLFVSTLSFNVLGSMHSTQQSTAPYNVVFYVETAEYEKFDLLEQELMQSPQKIISVEYSMETHELTINYTELIRLDTILQIVYRYFGIVEITGGNYIK